MDSQSRRRALQELLENTETPLNVTVLSESLAVSPRTVHNDLAALRKSGLSIQSLMGRSGGFWLDRPSQLATEPAPKTNSSDTLNRSTSASNSPEAQRTEHQFEFVGRDHEYARIGSAIHQVVNGTGRIITLSGEAGIGKSRLCRRIAEQIDDQNFTVHWGLCHEDVGMPPFWPWTQVLRSILVDSNESAHDSQQRSLPKQGQALLAEISPESRPAQRQPASMLPLPNPLRFQLPRLPPPEL